MTSSSIHFRAVTTSDAEVILSWRNDPTTRAQSLDEHVITTREHWAYLRARVPLGFWWMIEQEEAPLGYIRMDDEVVNSGGWYQVRSANVVVSPEHRNKGWGTALITLGTAACWRMGYEICVARIKDGNQASMRAFEKCGYTEDPDQWTPPTDKGVLRYYISREASRDREMIGTIPAPGAS